VTGRSVAASDRIADAVVAVRARIDAAARTAGRDPATVMLVGVAKWQPVSAVEAACRAGLCEIGENYAQELVEKARQVHGVRWHFIGRLQRNKVGLIVNAGALVHSLDSVEVARALGRRAVAAGRVVRALVQVEVDDRGAAHGIRPHDLPDFLTACRGIKGLETCGLMVMPAFGHPDASRAAYAGVSALRARHRDELPELSMGMSHDFEAAVAEGATMVRVGTALFGPRPVRPDRSA
jgi:pyridoxal phosphate enzyme (YggS family)